MASYSQRVNTGNDNGYWAGSWLNNPSSIGVGKNFFGQDVYMAMRFASVNIPQGTTISSATITLTASQTDSSRAIFKLFGIAEDDAGDVASDPVSRTKTSANTSKDINGETNNNTYTIDVTSIVQEIINRGGWVSGNHLLFISQDNGTSNSNILRWVAYAGDSTKAPLLDITWSGSSPSASMSPSASRSPSASASSSRSPSASMSKSPSPSLAPEHFVMRVAKPGKDALRSTDPRDFIYSSDYGTLKYSTKETLTVQIDGSAGDFAGKGIITHNLGYYPFIEVFVSVYIGSPSGNFEYCPFFGSGASVAYSASFLIKQNTIELFAEFSGVSTSLWNFEFLAFIYKNNLSL